MSLFRGAYLQVFCHVHHAEAARMRHTASPLLTKPGRRTRAYQRLRPGYFRSSTRLFWPFRNEGLMLAHCGRNMHESFANLK